MQVSFCSSIAQSSPTDLAVAPISGIMHYERTQGWQPKGSELVNRRVPSGGLGTTQRQVFCPVDMTPQVIGVKLFAIVDHVLPTPTPAFAQLCRAHRLAPSFFMYPDRGYRTLGISGSNRDSRDRRPCTSCLARHAYRPCMFLPLSHVSKPNVNITSQKRVRNERTGTRRKVRKLYGSVREDRSLKTSSQLGWLG
jgi:hypothetical protein